MDNVTPEILYPRLLRRVRAFLFDSVIFVILLYAWLATLPVFENAQPLLKISLLVIPIVILEPVLVAFTGGTLGHHFMGLRIRDASSDQNIGVLQATARAIIRTLLGWLSFIFVLVTNKHQALHDYFTSTVVILRSPESLPAHERFVARAEGCEQYRYPSIARRIAVILIYVFLGFLMLVALSMVALSEICLNGGHCTPGEMAVSQLLSIFWLLSLGASIVLGWKGRLYGCRRSPLPRCEAADV
ncbi:MAG: RDD family protein [Pseudomonadota bacterium]